jgi:radical SAM-linked protein
VPDRWAIRLAVEGDLRFLSHHDMMRAMERIAGRAKLPLRYSQGFNPRPILSLPCPRPVGVATRDDVLILALDASVSPDALLSDLRAHAPEGLSFLDATLLPDGQTSVQPARVEYEAPVEPGRAPVVQRCIEALRNKDAWVVERRRKPRRRSKDASPRTRGLDVKPMVAELELRENRLRFTCVPHEQKWAKPSEVLHLVGLSQPEDAAGVMRTKLHTGGTAL